MNVLRVYFWQNSLFMKYTFLLLAFFVFSFTTVLAQKEERASYRNYFERGNKVIGLQLGVAGEYPINSVTVLDINESNKRYGLLALPSFGWFIERNFVLGAQAIVGFNHDSYSYSNYDYSVNPPRYMGDTKSTSKGVDLGVAPFARYYVPLGRRNVVSLFGQGSFPVLYSSYESGSNYNSTYPGWSNLRYKEEGLKLMASLGGGVSINGRFGSFEMSANNTGLYLGYQRYFGFKGK